MKRSTPVKAKKEKLFIPRTRREETLPFPEQPSYDQVPGDSGSPKNDAKASELFSRFTADIIKKDVVFTR